VNKDKILSELWDSISGTWGVLGGIALAIIVYGPQYIKEISAWKSARVRDKLSMDRSKRALDNNINKRLKKKGGKK